MIGVGAPFILGAAIFGALVTVVLHFLSVRRPRVLLLPTMRFLPDRPVRAVSRSARPSDLWLLLMRVAALLLAGIALGGVTWRGTGVKHGRVVVIQRGAGGVTTAMQTQVARAIDGGFAADTVMRIVMVDSAVHLLTATDSRAFRADTLSTTARVSSGTSATLSAAILVATRAAGALVRDERTVDAVDLVIAAPLLRASVDASLPAVRASWPGTIRFVDIEPSANVGDSIGAVRYKRSVALVGADASEAVRSALLARGWLLGATANSSKLSTVPAAVGVRDDASASLAPVAVEWPASGVPEGWDTSAATTVGGLVARGEVLVFPFARTARVPTTMLSQGRAIAWWSDGEVAAIEVPTATACTRHVGVNVPSASDVLQGAAATALLLALSGPCGGEFDHAQISAAEIRALEGTGGAAPASAFKSMTAVRTPWAAILLVLALALLIAEWIVRDREDREALLAVPADEARRKVA